MKSSSTKQDTVGNTVAATTGIAMHAVARHMLDHDLQVTAIDAPMAWRGETSIKVHVPNDDGAGYWSARWQDTLAVDGITTEPIGLPGLVDELASLHERHVVHGRLPDTGVRVSVVVVRRRLDLDLDLVPRRSLVSLPGGAA